VIVPDRHGTGTNGLLLVPPEAIAPSFGVDSRARHEALARDADVECVLERPSSLLLDIDTGADLAALRERLDGAAGGAPLTRAVLAHPEQQSIKTIVNAR
jgi:2-phospho-L-lactate guanylyltransferase